MPSGPPPYAPGFGDVPPAPIGRDELLDRHQRRLLHARADPYRCWALIGERGVGKTVFLTMLADRMRTAGWACVDYSAGSGADPVDDLLALIPDAVGRQWRDRHLWGGLERELIVEINTGLVRVESKVTRAAQPAQGNLIGLRQMLERIGPHAAEEQVGLLITIDEAHRLGPHLEALGSVMQMVTMRHRQPVAWVLAGTRDLADLLLRSGSFPERMQRDELAMLTAEQSRLALIEPAAQLGVSWDPEAVARVAAAAQGYPYFIQVGGYSAWAAEPGEQAVGRPAADRGVAAIAADADRMFGNRWSRLGPAQRRYLAAATIASADADPAGISTARIAQILGREQKQLSVARNALMAEHHLLRPTGHGYLEFAIPLFERWLSAQLTAQPPGHEFAGVLPARNT